MDYYISDLEYGFYKCCFPLKEIESLGTMTDSKTGQEMPKVSLDLLPVSESKLTVHNCWTCVKMIQEAAQGASTGRF